MMKGLVFIVVLAVVFWFLFYLAPVFVEKIRSLINKDKGDKMGKMMSFFLAVILVSGLCGCGFEQIGTGHRGVKTTFGKVVSESLEEGLYFYNPLTSSITELDTRTQRADFDVSCYTKDIQQAKVKITVSYNLQRDKAHLALKDFGKDWMKKILPQTIEGSSKNVIGKWDAVDLITNREKARVEIENMLATSVKDKYVAVTKVEMTNVTFNEEFEKAIEAKVTAIQRASEAQNKTKQIEEEAKQRVIAAEAEAKSMTIRAQALTQNRGLTEWEAVQKWNGVLPAMMLGGNGAIPFINISK